MRPLAATTGTGERYADALGELWSGLAHTLTRLDRIAGAPAGLVDDEVLESLRRLQYSLHLASEHAYGLDPPSGAESAHAELADALAAARDATAEIAETVEEIGAEAVDVLLHEWRGALFRVRLARLRLAGPPVRTQVAAEPEERGFVLPLAAVLLALGGALAFAVGAAAGNRLLWIAGLIGVCLSVGAYRP